MCSGPYRTSPSASSSAVPGPVRYLTNEAATKLPTQWSAR